MTTQRLADHDDFRITLHKAQAPTSDKLVITFGGQNSDLADQGFGTDFCLNNGWDTVFVAQKYGTQYQGLSLDHFFDTLSEVADGREIICYGSDLGAYAALYYGGVLDAHIYAAAPMLPAWRPLANKAYADLPMTHLELAETPISRFAPVIIYDPMLEQDAFVVENMVRPAYPAFRKIEVPYGGHTVLVTLSQARLLKPVITALLDRDEIIDFTPPAEGTAVWHAQRGKALIRTDADAAIAELEKSLTIRAATQPYCILLNALLRKGDLGALQQRVDAAKATGEKRLRAVPSLAKKLEEAGITL